MFCGTRYKRLSNGKFHWWPAGRPSADGARAATKTLAAHQLHVLLSAGNPEAVQAAPVWRAVSPAD
jgi:transposase